MAIQQNPNRNSYNQNPSYNNYRYTNPQQGYPPRATYSQQSPQPNQQNQPNQQIPPRNNKLLMRILFVSLIIIIIASVLFLVKYQFSRLTTPISLENQNLGLTEKPAISEKPLDKTFNKDYCLSLLRNHLSFPELSFTEKGPLPNMQKAIINGNKESYVVLTIDDNPSGKELQSCSLYHNSETSTDFSKASKYTCNNGIALQSSESKTNDFSSISLRITIGEKINDIIAYSSPEYSKFPQIKQSLITTFKCTEAQK